VSLAHMPFKGRLEGILIPVELGEDTLSNIFFGICNGSDFIFVHNE